MQVGILGSGLMGGKLGTLFARAGHDKVCALHKGEVEVPSDYVGVLYVPKDSGGGWKLQVAREMKAAGDRGQSSSDGTVTRPGASWRGGSR